VKKDDKRIALQAHSTASNAGLMTTAATDAPAVAVAGAEAGVGAGAGVGTIADESVVTASAIVESKPESAAAAAVACISADSVPSVSCSASVCRQ
jgi:hypothetical protein